MSHTRQTWIASCGGRYTHVQGRKITIHMVLLDAAPCVAQTGTGAGVNAVPPDLGYSDLASSSANPAIGLCLFAICYCVCFLRKTRTLPQHWNLKATAEMADNRANI